MRDANDTAITVCNMENIDPVGIHTGDSIVVAPSQTLTNKEYHLLRDSALRLIRALKIEGGCNARSLAISEGTTGSPSSRHSSLNSSRSSARRMLS